MNTFRVRFIVYIEDESYIQELLVGSKCCCILDFIQENMKSDLSPIASHHTIISIERL